MNTFYEFPSTILTTYYGIEIYDVNRAAAIQNSFPVEIDIGTLDTLYIRDGFYYKEPLPGETTMRWTTGNATLEIPMNSDSPVAITIRAMIYRPETVSATPVTIFLDNQEIGQFTPGDSWQNYTFSAHPAPVNGISTLQFKSTPFNPAKLYLNNDTRNLGFLLDWVKIQ